MRPQARSYPPFDLMVLARSDHLSYINRNRTRPAGTIPIRLIAIACIS